MKKFYAFLAAALISVCAFASKDVIPSDSVLAHYYETGNVCVCVFVPADMACNEIVLTGSFNEWTTSWDGCAHFEKVEGYDGWYVASFEPEDHPDSERGIQAKPMILDAFGQFSWDYQAGAATHIRGGVQIVPGGFGDEIDFINYGTDAPNVFTVDAWRSNPCTAVYHNYTITVISAGCDGLAWPYVVGGMNNWEFTKMRFDQEKTYENNAPTYVYSFNAAENTLYQLLSGLMDESGDIVIEPTWNADNYLMVLSDGMWIRIPGEDGDNLLTHAEENIVFDLRDANLRWARCDAEPTEEVTVRLIAPQGAPTAIDIIGSFDEWSGSLMTLNNDGIWEAAVFAKASDIFKFREAGDWSNEIEVYDWDTFTWASIPDGALVFGELWSGSENEREIWLDFSSPEYYRWEVPSPEGTDNVSANNIKVYGHNENVIITNMEKNDPIAIYSENGMLVKEFIADSNRMRIKLQSGLYLVKVNGMTVKVLL